MKKICASFIILMLCMLNCTPAFALVTSNEFNDLTLEEVIARRRTPNDNDLEYSINPSYLGYYTIEDLEKSANLVVRAEVLEGSENFIPVNRYPGDGSTITPIKIKQIYSSFPDVPPLQVDDVIKIRERYVSFEYKGVRNKQMHQGYDASDVGREYYFFLEYLPYFEKSIMPREKYIPYMSVDDIFGRYPVISAKIVEGKAIDSYPNEDLNLRKWTERAKEYKTVYKDILRKYQDL